jgi:hypothetical protein
LSVVSEKAQFKVESSRGRTVWVSAGVRLTSGGSPPHSKGVGSVSIFKRRPPQKAAATMPYGRERIFWRMVEVE